MTMGGPNDHIHISPLQKRDLMQGPVPIPIAVQSKCCSVM